MGELTEEEIQRIHDEVDDRFTTRDSVGIQWPTPALRRAVEKHRGDELINWNLNTREVSNVTEEDGHENLDLILRFRPIITLLGPSLAAEVQGFAFRKLGGILVRVLKKRDSDELCLQYILTYTRQVGAVSWIWDVMVPILMLIWYEFTLLFSIPLFWTLFALIPFFIIGLYPHYQDFRSGLGIRFAYRSTTLLALFWIILSLTLINQNLRVILLIIAIICLFWWIGDTLELTPTGHPMDYVPVFVWIKKEKEDWIFERAVWDVFHYTAKMQTKEELNKTGNLIDDSHVSLLMDSPWHSLAAGSVTQLKRFWLWSWLIAPFAIILFLIIVSVVFVTGGNPTAFLLSSLIGRVLAFIIIPFLVSSSISLQLRRPTELMSFADEKHAAAKGMETALITQAEDPDYWGEEQMQSYARYSKYMDLKKEWRIAHFGISILRTLWNLRKKKTWFGMIDSLARRGLDTGTSRNPDDSPRLLIITKLQDPFSYKEGFKSFKDEDIDVYQKLTKLQEEIDSYLYPSTLANDTQQMKLLHSHWKLIQSESSRRLEPLKKMVDEYLASQNRHFNPLYLYNVFYDQLWNLGLQKGIRDEFTNALFEWMDEYVKASDKVISQRMDIDSGMAYLEDLALTWATKWLRKYVPEIILILTSETKGPNT
ncbi:MAG: hypothetical protein ACFE7R_09310 [Candidatus Hodarchaeota archaeon]